MNICNINDRLQARLRVHGGVARSRMLHATFAVAQSGYASHKLIFMFWACSPCRHVGMCKGRWLTIVLRDPGHVEDFANHGQHWRTGVGVAQCPQLILCVDSLQMLSS